jgi:hypothetical protein
VFWILEIQKRRRLMTVKIKKKLTGSTGFSRATRRAGPGFKTLLISVYWKLKGYYIDIYKNNIF